MIEWLGAWIEFEKITLAELLTAATIYFALYQFWKGRREPIKEKALMYARAFKSIDAVISTFQPDQINRLLNEQFDDLLSLWPNDRHLFIRRLKQNDIELLDQCYLTYKNLLLIQTGYRELHLGSIREKAFEIQRVLVSMAHEDIDQARLITEKSTFSAKYKHARKQFIELTDTEDHVFTSGLLNRRYSYTLNEYHRLLGTTALDDINTLAMRKWWWRQRTTSFGR